MDRLERESRAGGECRTEVWRCRGASNLAFLFFLLSAVGGPRHGPASPRPVLAWGDQGDGTYRNPILKADYSDPDVIRVGDDFYLVASDFHFVGMQVLHSRDLVNWEIVGQVFPRLDMHPKYDEMNGYAQGTWAPTLRLPRRASSTSSSARPTTASSCGTRRTRAGPGRRR